MKNGEEEEDPEKTCYMYSKTRNGNKNNFEGFLDFFKKEDFKRYIKEIMKPIVHWIYNEIYIYIWFICMYNVFLIFLTLANLFILIRIFKIRKKNIYDE